MRRLLSNVCAEIARNTENISYKNDCGFLLFKGSGYPPYSEFGCVCVCTMVAALNKILDFDISFVCFVYRANTQNISTRLTNNQQQ